MANYLLNAGSINFTGNWRVASAVTNAIINSEASTINLSTGNSDSTAFTLAATSVDRFMIKIQGLITPTGTVTLSLRNSTNPGTNDFSVTVNASDLPANGWFAVSTASPVTPNGTDSYLIRLTRSVADSGSNRVTIHCSTASASNMSRLVFLSTTASPASGDTLMISGTFTAAATSSAYTVTLDNTATTTFGAAANTSVNICKGGTISPGTAGSTAYYLRFRGRFSVYSGGTMNETGLDSTSTLTFENDSASSNDSNLQVFSGGTVSLTAATKANCRVLLTADVAVAATTVTVADTTGLVANDVVEIASTTQSNQSERRTVSTVPTGTTFTTTALTNAHSGTSPTQAEMIVLTRQIKFKGVTAGTTSQIVVSTGGAWTSKYCEFSQWNGLSITATGTDIENSAFYDMNNSGVAAITYNAGANGFTCTNNVFTGAREGSVVISVTDTTFVCTGNWTVLNGGGNSAIMRLTAAGANGTFTNNIVAGVANGAAAFTCAATGPFVDFSGNVAHSNSGGNASMMQFTALVAGAVIGSFTAWRNAGSGGGIQLNGSGNDITINNLTGFGNGGASLTISTQCAGITISSMTSNGDTSFSQTSGISIAAVVVFGLKLIGSSFSVVSGIKTAHTNDVAVTSGGALEMVIENTTLNGTNPVSSGVSGLSAKSYVRTENTGKTLGKHGTYTPVGTILYDSSLFHSDAPSERLTPSSASIKLEGGPFRAAVASGATKTFAVYVRRSKTSTGDSATYNGNLPRLVLKANPSIGITTDTVLATATSSSDGAWEQISGTTAAATDDGVFECVVDCDGTAGWVSTDDRSVT